MNFKFGVLYAKAGQTTDHEMFRRTYTSDTVSLDDFLPYNPHCIGYRSLLNLIISASCHNFLELLTGDEVKLENAAVQRWPR